MVKAQFASAYLYETLYPEDYKRGCKNLVHGHLCRMMAIRKDIGWQSLKEIMDSSVADKEPIIRRMQRLFWRDFAFYSLMQAGNNYQEDSIACQESVFYYVKAITAEPSDSCTSWQLVRMAHFGQCMPKGDTRFDKYKELAQACPRV